MKDRSLYLTHTKKKKTIGEIATKRRQWFNMAFDWFNPMVGVVDYPFVFLFFPLYSFALIHHSLIHSLAIRDTTPLLIVAQ